MIDRMYCQDQLARLSGLPGYPKTDQGKSSLIDAMQGAFGFTGQDKLRRWIEDVLRHCDRCPLPRDVYKRGLEITPDKPKPKVQCFLCYDSGKSSAEFLVTWKNGKAYRQELTTEQAAALWKKHREAQARGDKTATFAPEKQMIYEGPVECACQRKAPLPPPPDSREWAV